MNARSADGLHTLGRWPGDVARRTPNRIAIDDGTDRISYAELDNRADTLARALCTAGCQPGDRVATLTGNSAAHLVLFFACARARLVLVPLSWRLAAREIAEQLAHAEPALFVVHPRHTALATAALARMTEPPRETTFAALAAKREHQELEPVRDEDPVLMLYTSGTSGRPKGVVLTHANCFWTNLSLSRTVPLTSSDVVLQILPQFHVGGWNVQPLLACWVGATVLVERGFDAGRVLRLIAERRVRTMMGVPANYLFLSEHPDFASTDLSSLGTIIVGGAPMPEALLRTWHRRGVTLVQGYGSVGGRAERAVRTRGPRRRQTGLRGYPVPARRGAVGRGRRTAGARAQRVRRVLARSGRDRAGAARWLAAHR